ncbi:protein of unknown function [Acetoanaerobium sticklandii]|uniref:Uncharacterized protein n=1 Tax=Acetoanaerobium sticklandii (strain ATCC 12662 / DSM 519 / JCM 1433 / CCUG 9281 / NCIMB 10654 / HF) TaxID=499177 RepID=E3PWC9_ACESD|nr:protein of unknown function [Acetoanaerobium sticklandii]
MEFNNFLLTIFILTFYNNLLPIETELKDVILLFMFSLSAVLLRKGFKDIEKKENVAS